MSSADLKAELRNYLPEQVVDHLGRKDAGSFELVLKNLLGGTVIVRDEDYEARDLVIQAAKVVGEATAEGLTLGWGVGAIAECVNFLFSFRKAQIVLTFEEGVVAQDLLNLGGSEGMTASDLTKITRLKNKAGEKFHEAQIVEILQALSVKKTRAGSDAGIVAALTDGRWIAKNF